MTAPILAAAMLATSPIRGADAEARFFSALAVVEGTHGTSDGHRAKGPFQIHCSYWRDACVANPNLRPFGYGACSTTLYSRAVVRAYAKRFRPDAWLAQDWFKIAQLHHVGPDGQRKGRGKAFAARVVAMIEEEKEKTCKP